MSIKSLFRTVICAGAAAVMLTGGAAIGQAAPATAPDSSISTASINAENVITVTSANYQSVMETSKTKLVILDFSATWCGPCQKLKPVIEKLAREYNGRFLLGEVDTDTQRTLTSQYRIKYLPTLVGVRNTAELTNGRTVGFNGEAALRKWIDAQLAKG